MKSDFTLRGESHLSGVNLKEIQVVLATYFYRYPSPKNLNRTQPLERACLLSLVIPERWTIAYLKILIY